MLAPGIKPRTTHPPVLRFVSAELGGGWRDKITGPGQAQKSLAGCDKSGFGYNIFVIEGDFHELRGSGATTGAVEGVFVGGHIVTYNSHVFLIDVSHNGFKGAVEAQGTPVGDGAEFGGGP